jgi:hypothetical protein
LGGAKNAPYLRFHRSVALIRYKTVGEGGMKTAEKLLLISVGMLQQDVYLLKFNILL